MQTPEHARTRRRFLAGSAAAGVAGLAGCGALNANESAPDTETPGDSGTDEERPTEAADTLPAPSLGPEDAPVTVLAFEDYACPHCREYSLEVFPEIKSEYVDSGDVYYEFHDLPIPVTEQSEPAASAARAVQDTVGVEAFWTYSKSLFENQNSLGPDTYADLAAAVGADPETVRTAAVERRYADTVQADRAAGIERGISGTPGIIVDGGDPLGSYAVETVTGAIEDAL
jgi:protein-disulfide isomerase